MSLRWRVGLAAIIAAAVVAGFVPHGTLAVAQTSAAKAVQLAESPVSSGPVHCLDATCGKGTPAAAAPAPGIAVAATLTGLAAVAGAVASLRRRPARAAVLPSGICTPLFHPPQFS
jgi:hypothetical protein